MQLFISDLHLSERRPGTLTLFEHFIQSLAPQSEALYILGDFFDYWIGNDDQSAFHRHVQGLLKKLSQGDTLVFMLPGNRDFLLDEKFTQNSGATLIEDPHLITFNNASYLLMHGDTLCTQDWKYQIFRKLVRSRLFRQCFLSLSLSIRRKLAKNMRDKSRRSQAGRPYVLAYEPTVAQIFKTYPIDALLHGHTHEEKIYTYPLLDKKRFVLGEWTDTHGSYLKLDHTGVSLHPYSHP